MDIFAKKGRKTKKLTLAEAIAAVRSDGDTRAKQDIVCQLYALAISERNRELFQFLEARDMSLSQKETEVIITVNRVSNHE